MQNDRQYVVKKLKTLTKLLAISKGDLTEKEIFRIMEHCKDILETVNPEGEYEVE